MKTEVEEYYKLKAKNLTNMLFDKGFLADNLAREAIGWLEDYLGFVFQSHCEMAAEAAVLSKSLRDKAAAPKESSHE